MTDEGKRRAGPVITESLRNISEEEWDAAMKRAEQAEEDRRRWIAGIIKDKKEGDDGGTDDKKKIERYGAPLPRPTEP